MDPPSSIPWVEKYRPSDFDEIVLDPLNKTILKTILDKLYFPNLLLYGPPGTGKTTTIINLINAYQDTLQQRNKGLLIHLNASDERGIDTIRNQINQFVNSKSLFHQGMKFVVLDEVDYMTKNAQQALRYLLQSYSSGVRFCLICNYISRIDEGLQNEFLKLRFNQLPQEDIIRFLRRIAQAENLSVSDKTLEQIQQMFRSDIRSMVNFMQANESATLKNDDDEVDDGKGTYCCVMDESVWEVLIKYLRDGLSLALLIGHVNDLSERHNVDKKSIVKCLFSYIIRTRGGIVDRTRLLHHVENILHFEECRDEFYVNYSLAMLLTLSHEL